MKLCACACRRPALGASKDLPDDEAPEGQKVRPQNGLLRSLCATSLDLSHVLVRAFTVLQHCCASQVLKVRPIARQSNRHSRWAPHVSFTLVLELAEIVDCAGCWFFAQQVRTADKQCSEGACLSAGNGQGCGTPCRPCTCSPS